jgi:putative transposase
MPRPQRIQFPGATYHVNVHGVDDRHLFVDDADHVFFELRLDQVVNKCGWEVLAYCALGTHVHLTLRTPLPNLADGMRDLSSAYCQGFNRRRGRRGHLLRERYHYVVVQSESHLRRSIRYVVLNPVNAGLAAWPGSWEWSSFAATAGLCEPPDFLAVDTVLDLFGRDRKRAREHFARFVAEGMPLRT